MHKFPTDFRDGIKVNCFIDEFCHVILKLGIGFLNWKQEFALFHLVVKDVRACE